MSIQRLSLRDFFMLSQMIIPNSGAAVGPPRHPTCALLCAMVFTHTPYPQYSSGRFPIKIRLFQVIPFVWLTTILLLSYSMLSASYPLILPNELLYRPKADLKYLCDVRPVLLGHLRWKMLAILLFTIPGCQRPTVATLFSSDAKS